MKENRVKDKSFAFAAEIVNLYKNLVYIKKEYVMSRQLLKSGTSIGANVREAEFALDLISRIKCQLDLNKQTKPIIGWITL